VNEIELTQLFIDYAETQKRAAELRAQIEAAVLERGESANIAGVKATYYKPGFETPDYKTAAKDAPAELVAQFSTTTTTTKWAEVCKAARRLHALNLERYELIKKIDASHGQYAGDEKLKITGDDRHSPTEL